MHSHLAERLTTQVAGDRTARWNLALLFTGLLNLVKLSDFCEFQCHHMKNKNDNSTSYVTMKIEWNDNCQALSLILAILKDSINVRCYDCWWWCCCCGSSLSYHEYFYYIKQKVNIQIHNGTLYSAWNACAIINSTSFLVLEII